MQEAKSSTGGQGPAGRGAPADGPLRALHGLIGRLAEAVRFYRTGAPPHEQFLTAFVFFLGVALATFGYFAVQGYYRSEAQRQLEGPAAQFSTLIGKTIDRHIDVINSVGAFLTASDEPDRWTFFEFTREVLPRYPGLRSLQWIPRVPAADRPGREAKAVSDGLFGFRFTARDATGKGIPAPPREEHYPVFFIEPFDGNEGSLGLDLAADRDSREVLQLARDIGTMVATQGAAREPDGTRPIIEVVLPIFTAKEIPATVAERREKLSGFVRGAFHLGDMLSATLPALTAPPGLDIYLYDPEAAPGRELIYYHPSPLREEQSRARTPNQVMAGLFTLTRHEVAGWTWSIVVKPVSSLFNVNVTMASYGIWAIVLLITALMVQYLVSSQTRTQAIEHSVTLRTAELSEANQALESEISERRRVEAELREAKERAEIASRAKSDFLAMMSHELRTPLNAVIGFSEILSTEALGAIGNKEYRDYAEDIRLSGTHLLSLINTILDLSKIEADRFELSEEEIDFADTLASVLPMVQEKIAVAELTLSIELPEILPRLHADARAIRQVLLNILSNAVKFTPEGGRIAVTAMTTRTEDFIVSISDTGIGIAEADQALVLEPFRQADSSLARKYEGTGLGLPLSTRLMELHGGRLQLESALGEGTTVSLVFPKERIVPWSDSDPAPPPGRTPSQAGALPERPKAGGAGGR